jgi:hypothetical protein
MLSSRPVKHGPGGQIGLGHQEGMLDLVEVVVGSHDRRAVYRGGVDVGDVSLDPGQGPGQVRLAGRPDPLPDRSEPVIPGSGECADRDRDQAGQWVDPPVQGARVGRRFQPLRHSRGQILAAGTGLDDARTHARQCHSGHAS